MNEMETKKIAIVGAGGINSWAIKWLHQLIEDFDRKLIYVKIFDNDEVEEKNLLRNNQNFQIDDLLSQKAEVLSERYNFDCENIFITEDNIQKLASFDDIILGVDNHKTRKLIYDFALKNNKYVLDMRAQGTIMGFTIIDGSKDMDYYNKKMFNNLEVMERKGSCQLKSDVENDHIENANRVIAMLGIYSVYLKRLRKEKVSTDEWKFVY